MPTPISCRGIGEARWDHAADAFGESVLFELKERVFLPFGSSTPVNPPDEHWTRVLDGRGMLGQMIECLLQTRVRNHSTAKQLSEWLTVNRPRLRERIHKTRPSRLRKLARLRGQAQHGSVTEAETREVFVVASDLLSAIAGN
jgi:hypothetical protein